MLLLWSTAPYRFTFGSTLCHTRIRTDRRFHPRHCFLLFWYYYYGFYRRDAWWIPRLRLQLQLLFDFYWMRNAFRSGTRCFCGSRSMLQGWWFHNTDSDSDETNDTSDIRNNIRLVRLFRWRCCQAAIRLRYHTADDDGDDGWCC
jgi:hypothetical protein